MEIFKAQSTEITIDGDVLTLTRKKIGKDDVRRIPLAAITELRVEPGGRFVPAMMQLVLNDEPPAGMTPTEPNTLLFPKTSKYTGSFDGLHARLQAAIAHNRSANTGPVAYDAPRRTASQRLADSARERNERMARQQAEAAARRAEADARRAEADAHRAAAARQEAEAAEQDRINRVRHDLASEGVTRDDVVSAAMATTFMGTVAAEIPALARTLLPDEPLLRATRASFDGQLGMIAVTPVRFIGLSKALWSDQTLEFPLTAIVSVGAERDLLTNELTVRLHSGQSSTFTNVDDLPDFTSTLREAVRHATMQVQEAAAAPQQDVLDQIAKLADLHAAGILTAEEFQSKKTELLNRL